MPPPRLARHPPTRLQMQGLTEERLPMLQAKVWRKWRARARGGLSGGGGRCSSGRRQGKEQEMSRCARQCSALQSPYAFIMSPDRDAGSLVEPACALGYRTVVWFHGDGLCTGVSEPPPLLPRRGSAALTIQRRISQRRTLTHPIPACTFWSNNVSSGGTFRTLG